ncbi:MAG: hypothetical protein GY835_15335 [bacterium]|nr:hypothetical protein [bacterium]
MTTTIRRSLTACLFLLLIGAIQPAIAAQPGAYPQALTLIDRAEKDGTIDQDTAALNRIYFVFDQERLAPSFQIEEDNFLKCGTSLLYEIQTNPDLSQHVQATLASYLVPPVFNDRAYTFSPSGHFRMAYATTGGDAVPLADDDSSGIPDFVEWCADYMDEAWAVLCDEWHFQEPLVPVGYYYVSFEALSGVYGFTTPYGPSTRIVLDNNFLGFPANDDPDGDQKGAAKVTCAHEFKHASQHTTSGWSYAEGLWKEIDAVWAEEFVQPQSNDYKWYANFSGSPLASPELSLDDGGTGSYAEGIWEMYMSQYHGTAQIIVDLWEIRRATPTMPFLQGYDEVLQAYGSDLSSTWGQWVRWNYLNSYREWEGYGYDDASWLYPARNWVNLQGLSGEQTATVPHLASRNARHFNFSGLEDHPRIIFSCDADVDIRPVVIATKHDDNVVFVDLELDANHDIDQTLTIPFSELRDLTISFPNCAWTGGAETFTYELLEGVISTVDGEIPGYGSMRLHPCYPNPFNPLTSIRFELASPAPVGLSIISPLGRVLRTLSNGREFSAGNHVLEFDGRDDSGELLASGVYFVRLDLGGGEARLSKMTLLK